MEATTVNPYTLEYLGPLLLTVVTLVLAVSFVVWISVFLLNFITDTSRRGYVERGHNLVKQITFGATLFCLLLVLVALQIGFFYQPYEPSTVIPKQDAHAETR